MEMAQSSGDLSLAAEIRYVVLPDVKNQLNITKSKLSSLQKNRRVLQEEIKQEDIANVVSNWTGVPINKLLKDESEKLLNLSNEIKQKIIGQDEVIESVVSAIKRARVGVGDPEKPTASFLFLGPTGVGKTELTLALAETIFGTKDSIIRVDMSEFMEKHAVSKLIGSPPGYVGYEESGGLTEKVRTKPYSLILFDEIEKAHPDTLNVLLQILDSGFVTDSKGRKVNFRNTIIILTGNIGARHISKMSSLGFSAQNSAQDIYRDIKDKVLDDVKRFFKPEFINRLDEIVIFDVLSKKDLVKIINIHIDRLKQRVEKEYGIKLKVSKRVINHLLEKGYTPEFGARPIKRLVDNQIASHIADFILNRGQFKSKTVAVDLDTAGKIKVAEKSAKTKSKKSVVGV